MKSAGKGDHLPHSQQHFGNHTYININTGKRKGGGGSSPSPHKEPASKKSKVEQLADPVIIGPEGRKKQVDIGTEVRHIMKLYPEQEL